MPKQLDGPLTKDVLVDETRFLLKTLLRDDLFGEEVSLTEAEKLLESSLSLGFVDYATFLKKRDYVVIDRTRNTVRVTPKGRLIADGMDDAEFHRELASHFATRLAAPAPSPSSSIAPRANTASRLPAASTSTLPAAASHSDDLRDGRYTRQEALGQGGLGTVYRGRNIYLQRDVAIKEYRHLFDYLTYLQRDDVLRRLRAAVMSHAALQSPFILDVLDLNFDKDPPYVILHLAQGGSLKDRLLRAKSAPGGVLPFPVATRLLFQLAYALHHAHGKGVIHADLKPENVLFDSAGNVKVADFGVARVVEKRPGEGPPVYMGVGNPSYLSPEQLHGSADVTAASDVYSYGILMYQVLTGTLPGRRSPMPSDVNKVVPKSLDNLFDAMTRDTPSERIQSMDAVLSGLYDAFNKEEVLTRGNLVLFDADPFPPTPRADAAASVPPPANVSLTAVTDVTAPDIVPPAGNGAQAKELGNA